jgi:TonB family protein
VTASLVDAILENSPTRPKSRALDWTLSLAVHGILVAAMFVVPLYRIDGIELHSLNYTQLVVTGAGVEPNAHVTVAPKSVAAEKNILVAPRSIPNPVSASRQQVGEADAGPETPPGIAGVIGIVGQGPAAPEQFESSGSLADISSANVRPPAREARPRSPVIVGGKIKAPRLISMVEPVYPPLLRRARVQGDVVIAAVIDTQGNVVEVHAVSGNDLLVPAAMDALRRWKYEPTVLDGQVYPVFLRVTIAFRLGVKS